MKKGSETNIDVGPVTSVEELHLLLARAFGFPDDYGQNWDAFDECVRDFPPQGELRTTGIQKLSAALPREAEQLKQCLEGFRAEMPDRRKVYLS